MGSLPEGIPIISIDFRTMQDRRKQSSGWIYPRRNISQFVPAFTKPEQAALSFFIIVAILLFLAGIILPIALSSWWWLLLMPGGIVVWRANRRSMELFFLENLANNEEFYDLVRRHIGEQVKLVVVES